MSGPKGELAPAPVSSLVDRERVPSRTGEIPVFCLTALTFLSVSFGGRLYVTEILVLLLLPVLVLSPQARRLRDPFAIRFFQLAALWFGGQVVTDLLRDTPINLLVKGWSLILFTAMNFAVLWMLVRTRRQVFMALAGIATGSLLEYAFNPGEFALGHPWKFGYGFALTLTAVILVAVFRLALPVCLAVLTFVAAVNALQGFRSLGGVCLAAAGMLILHRKGPPRIRITRGRAVTAIVGLGLFGFLLLHAYSFVAQEGLLGEAAQTTYRQQSGTFGPLLGGRKDVVFAAVAIEQSPLLGHGSWAQRSYETDTPAIAFLHRNGYSYSPRVRSGIDANVLPAHSHLLGAWVTAGLLGLPFWIWTMSLALQGIMSRFSSSSTGAVAMFIVCGLLWDILFSPFGASRRITFPLLLISVVVLVREGQTVKADRA